VTGERAGFGSAAREVAVKERFGRVRRKAFVDLFGERRRIA
jgi:hypothetical protein